MTGTQRHLPTLAIIFAGILLVGYLLLLIGSTYLGQVRMREAMLQQLELGLEKRAGAVSYFFAERKDDLATLIKDRSIETYFANRDLGMSMQYGLGASLRAISLQLLDFQARKTIQESRIYQGITFYGPDANIIATTYEAVSQGTGYRDCLNQQQIAILVRADSFGMPEISVCSRVRFKGRAVGYLVADVRRSLAFKKLVTEQAEAPAVGMLVYSLDNDMEIYRDGFKPATSLQQLLGQTTESHWPIKLSGDLFAFRALIPGTPFSLMAVYSLEQIHGVLSSLWFVAALAALAIPVLAGLGYLLWLNNHNLILKGNIRAARQQEASLNAHNLELQSEISRRMATEERLAHQANYDALTDLPNRNLAFDRLTQSIKRARRDRNRVLLMFVDLDHFKRINDTLGHASGDELLIQAVNRLNLSVRESDTISRLGGDEFVIICPDMTGIGRAEILAQNILESFVPPFHIKGHELFITASIGLAVYPDDGKDPETLLKNADMALYQSKDLGRNRYSFFDAGMDELAHKRVTMGAHLHHAIERDEFHLEYQPIVAVATGEVVGLEALLRWDNPVLGKVAPDHFIPLAEESGLIHDLGIWVLQHACRDAANWQSHKPVHLAVNISPKQLYSPVRLIEAVKQSLEQSGLPPEILELEITESSLIQDRPEIMLAMKELEAMGIRLSVDDFGTGYSALSYLQRFPFTTLKIDRSFIQHMLDNSANSALVHAILVMAKALDLTVIAEGVERAEQARFLESHQCRYAQGYLYGRPVLSSSIRRLLCDKSVQRQSSA